MNVIKSNTENALKELENELKRLNGKVVLGDYRGYDPLSSLSSSRDGHINYRSIYSLDPNSIMEDLMFQENANNKSEEEEEEEEGNK